MSFFSDLTGQDFGALRDLMQQGFNGGSFSEGGKSAISAFDPLISKERFGNLANHSVGGGDIFNTEEMDKQSGLANTVGQIATVYYGGGYLSDYLGGGTGGESGLEGLGGSSTQTIDPSSQYGNFLTQMGEGEGYSTTATSPYYGSGGNGNWWDNLNTQQNRSSMSQTGSAMKGKEEKEAEQKPAQPKPLARFAPQQQTPVSQINPQTYLLLSRLLQGN